MATYSTLTALFSDIADAIREKTGTTAAIAATDFPAMIRLIGTVIFNNLFNPSTATLNQRWSNSSYQYQASGGTGMVVTDYIPISLSSDTSNPTVMHFKGATMNVTNTGFNYYNASKVLVQASDMSTGTGVGATYPNISVTTDEDGNYQTNLGWKGGKWHSEWANAAYMRVTLKVKDTAITSDDIQDIIITIDERIGD